MPSVIPELGQPFLREFLYVDVDRVRSLLAQLAEGAPEQVKEIEQRHSKWTNALKLRFSVVEGGPQVERGNTSGNEETRALSDLHFVMFEETAQQTGFLRELSADAQRPKLWKRGALHRALREGQVIRLTAPTRVIDPRHVGEMFAQFDNALSTSTAAAGITPAEVKKMIDALYGPGVVVRSFPAGLDEPECHFVGTLLNDTRYIESERSTLFARHGFVAQEWTLVAQVARLPSTPSNTPPLFDPKELTPGGTLDRMKLEDFMARMTVQIEQHGMAESPKHPAIAVTPLAVYRVVTPHENPDAPLQE